MLSRRAGHALLELLLAVAAGAIVVAAAVRLHVAQERASRTLFGSVRADARAREAAAILPITLRALAPREGDVPAGMATDTALELRETVASAVVCAVGSGGVVLPDDSDDGATLAGYLSRPDAGDSAWFVPLAATDTGGARWVPALVTAVAGAPCDSIGVLAPSGGGLRLSLAADVRARGVGIGSPVRVTRRARYSLYRSGGAWYLGYRSWSPVLGRLATVQPVSGPYESPTAAGAPFHYFRADGTELAAPVVQPESIARVDVRLRPAAGPREPGSDSAARASTLSITVAVRNR